MIVIDLDNIDNMDAYYYASLTSKYNAFYCYDTNKNLFFWMTANQLDNMLLNGELINGFYLDSDKETVRQKPFWYKDILFFTDNGIYYEDDYHVIWYSDGNVYYRIRRHDLNCLGFGGFRLQRPLRHYELEYDICKRKRLCSMQKDKFLQDYQLIALKLQMTDDSI